MAYLSPGSCSPPPTPAPGCEFIFLQTSATAASSGGGVGIYSPDKANDGVQGIPDGNCRMHWIETAGPYPDGAWFSLTWPTPVNVCQIFCDTKAYDRDTDCGYNTNRIIGFATIQYWDDSMSDWITDGSVSDKVDDWTYVFSRCITTTAIRIYDVYCPDLGTYDHNPILYELNVYECSVTSPTPTYKPTITPTQLAIPSTGTISFIVLIFMFMILPLIKFVLPEINKRKI